MNKITLENFRCFRGKQEARLAPLTLLVGENSTGKTSFLALIRALWDAAFEDAIPNFKKEPYDLGSYDEIAHYQGKQGGRAPRFEAGFEISSSNNKKNAKEMENFCFHIVFHPSATTPFLARRHLARGGAWIEEQRNKKRILFGTRPGHEQTPKPLFHDALYKWYGQDKLIPLSILAISPSVNDARSNPQSVDERGINKEEGDIIFSLANDFKALTGGLYASAPVRSKPRRVYEPSPETRDPDGEHTPMYLGRMHLQNRAGWRRLKNSLEEFGQNSGLFDEISVKTWGKKGSAPFQLQIRKFSGTENIPKGSPRNLIDVGYGISQVLPVVTELLRPDAPAISLLQQPEVHLHPSAQAALGSLFCELAESGRQLVVETHSDYLLDRVRMDVRDGKSNLKPDDVSILFFERGDLDVRIHELGLDDNGNVLGAPDGYREFFRKETQRSLNL